MDIYNINVGEIKQDINCFPAMFHCCINRKTDFSWKFPLDRKKNLHNWYCLLLSKCDWQWTSGVAGTIVRIIDQLKNAQKPCASFSKNLLTWSEMSAIMQNNWPLHELPSDSWLEIIFCITFYAEDQNI